MQSAKPVLLPSVSEEYTDHKARFLFYFPSVFFSVFWSHIDTHCEGKLWIHLLELLAEMLLCGCLLVFHDQRGLDLRGHLRSHQLLHDGQGKLKAGARASACNDVAIFLNAGL